MMFKSLQYMICIGTVVLGTFFASFCHADSAVESNQSIQQKSLQNLVNHSARKKSMAKNKLKFLNTECNFT